MNGYKEKKEELIARWKNDGNEIRVYYRWDLEKNVLEPAQKGESILSLRWVGVRAEKNNKLTVWESGFLELTLNSWFTLDMNHVHRAFLYETLRNIRAYACSSFMHCIS